MSAAATTANDATDAPPARKSRKKLLIVVGAVVLLLGVASAAAVVLLKKRAAAEHDDHAEAAPPKIEVRDAKSAPAFVPLDVFTVNLADKQADRYAQIGITLELDDPKLADTVKAFLPAVRNNVLLLLASKSAADLSEAGGKQKLAVEVQTETLKALGADPEALAAARQGTGSAPPIRAVYFSTFIIQ